MSRDSQTNSRDVVRDVLAASDIVEILGIYLELKPAGGGRLKALCPFHNEDTPSFMVSRDRQTYHCFGCDKGGDVIDFLKEHEGLTFPEALEKLADRAGIQLPKYSGRSGDGDARKELLEFAKFAAKTFRDQLVNTAGGKRGRTYLESRAMSQEIFDEFNVGFVPDEWNTLTDAAKAANFSEKIVENSGLARRGDRGGLYDFFRNRVVFPIRDVAGNVVAFGGRDLGDSPAKYINSPESSIYKKTRVLYGLYEAREAIKTEGAAVLVEGYFDLLRCFDAGIRNAVATCGTALTPEQAALIKRYVPEVVVVFDGDAAGVKAAMRGIAVLTAAGLRVRPLALPDGQDPDDFIRDNGADAFRELASKTRDFVTFYVQAAGERAHTIEGRTEIATELFAIIRDIQDGLRRDEYLKRIAEELGLNADRCRDEFARFNSRKAQQRPTPETAAAPETTFSLEDQIFLASLLTHEPLLDSLRDVLEQNVLPESPMKEVLVALVQAGAETNILEALESDEARRLYAAASNTEETWGEKTEEHVRKHIVSFHRESLKRRARSLQEELERAQRASEHERAEQLLLEKIEVDKEIQRIGAA